MMIRRSVWVLSAVPLLLGSLAWVAASDAIAASRSSRQAATQTAQATPGQQRQGDRTQGHRRGPDFAAAAEQLGVTEAALIEALGLPSEPPANGERPPRPDFAAAAQQLGVTEQQIMDALGGPPPDQGGPGGHRGPDFAAAAEQLGVTEQQIMDALGVPAEPPANGERPPRPDFAAAASQLGVTEDQLMDALGVPDHGGDRPDGAQGNRPTGRPQQNSGQ